MKFPLTLEAIKKGDQNQWAIGDALLAECGPPSTVGMKWKLSAFTGSGRIPSGQRV
jgi:hypothetical protein